MNKKENNNFELNFVTFHLINLTHSTYRVACVNWNVFGVISDIIKRKLNISLKCQREIRSPAIYFQFNLFCLNIYTLL